MTLHRTLATLGLAVLMLATLSGCRSDVVKVDPKNPKSPKYPYLAHEFALLQLAVDDIQELERKKQYGKIYDDYASDNFRRHVSRRKFLVMANCTEEHLGELSEYDDSNLSFNRNQMPDKNKPALDSITRQVTRSKSGQVQEQLVFASDGLHFKLNGLYWISDEDHFLKCIQQADKLAEPKPAPAKTDTPTPEKAAKTPGQSPPPAVNAPKAPDKPGPPVKATPKPGATPQTTDKTDSKPGMAPKAPAGKPAPKPAAQPTSAESPADKKPAD